MTCQELAKCIEKMQPEALPREVARLCLLLCNCVEDLDELKDGERLSAGMAGYEGPAPGGYRPVRRHDGRS